jgi:hypothetical protein
MRKITTQTFAVIMLIPFSIFLVNGIRAGFIYTLHLSEEPFHMLASSSPFFFYLFEAVAILVTTLFLLWGWQRYWKKTNWWLLPVFLVGIIGSVYMGIFISNFSDLSGLQYRGCGEYLSTGFSEAVEKQDISFCSNPHDYTRVHIYEEFGGGDFCILPGGNRTRIARINSNEFDPVFSSYCFEALAVQMKQPEVCFKTISSDRSSNLSDGISDCIAKYARRERDVGLCELLTQNDRDRCIYSYQYKPNRVSETAGVLIFILYIFLFHN